MAFKFRTDLATILLFVVLVIVLLVVTMEMWLPHGLH